MQPKYLILETATLERPDDAMHKMAWAAAGNWGVFIRSPQEFNIFPVLTGVKPEVKSGTRGADWHDLVRQLLFHDVRNGHILRILMKHRSEKCLVMTPQVGHARALDKLLTLYRMRHGVFCGNDSEYDDSPILIGTFGKLGTGFDEETFCKTYNGVRINVLIMCLTVKKPTTLNQNVGRVMRSSSPITYVLVDDNGIIKSHFSIMKWYFETYTNGTIQPALDFKRFTEPPPIPVTLKIRLQPDPVSPPPPVGPVLADE